MKEADMRTLAGFMDSALGACGDDAKLASIKEEVKEIADLLLKEISDRLKEQQGVNLQVSDGFKERVISEGYDVSYGARPLRRVLMRLLEDNLAQSILSGDLSEGDTAYVDVDDEGKIRLTEAAKKKQLQPVG
jgi:ATP-dependent Clp protease ATP-binding subunit ClpC